MENFVNFPKKKENLIEGIKKLSVLTEEEPKLKHLKNFKRSESTISLKTKKSDCRLNQSTAILPSQTSKFKINKQDDSSTSSKNTEFCERKVVLGSGEEENKNQYKNNYIIENKNKNNINLKKNENIHNEIKNKDIEEKAFNLIHNDETFNKMQQLIREGLKGELNSSLIRGFPLVLNLLVHVPAQVVFHPILVNSCSEEIIKIINFSNNLLNVKVYLNRLYSSNNDIPHHSDLVSFENDFFVNHKSRKNLKIKLKPKEEGLYFGQLNLEVRLDDQDFQDFNEINKSHYIRNEIKTNKNENIKNDNKVLENSPIFFKINFCILSVKPCLKVFELTKSLEDQIFNLKNYFDTKNRKVVSHNNKKTDTNNEKEDLVIKNEKLFKEILKNVTFETIPFGSTGQGIFLISNQSQVFLPIKIKILQTGEHWEKFRLIKTENESTIIDINNYSLVSGENRKNENDEFQDSDHVICTTIPPKDIQKLFIFKLKFTAPYTSLDEKLDFNCSIQIELNDNIISSFNVFASAAQVKIKVKTKNMLTTFDPKNFIQLIEFYNSSLFRVLLKFSIPDKKSNSNSTSQIWKINPKYKLVNAKTKLSLEIICMPFMKPESFSKDIISKMENILEIFVVPNGPTFNVTLALNPHLSDDSRYLNPIFEGHNDSQVKTWDIFPDTIVLNPFLIEKRILFKRVQIRNFSNMELFYQFGSQSKLLGFHSWYSKSVKPKSANIAIIHVSELFFSHFYLDDYSELEKKTGKMLFASSPEQPKIEAEATLRSLSFPFFHKFTVSCNGEIKEVKVKVLGPQKNSVSEFSSISKSSNNSSQNSSTWSSSLLALSSTSSLVPFYLTMEEVDDIHLIQTAEKEYYILFEIYNSNIQKKARIFITNTTSQLHSFSLKPQETSIIGKKAKVFTVSKNDFEILPNSSFEITVSCKEPKEICYFQEWGCEIEPDSNYQKSKPFNQNFFKILMVSLELNKKLD